MNVPEIACSARALICLFAAMIGSIAKKWAADDNQQRALHLGEIEQKLATSSQLLRVALAPLATKIEEAAAIAESAVSKLRFPIAFHVCALWHSGSHSVGKQEACMNKELEQGPVVLVVVEDRRKAVVEDFQGRLVQIACRFCSSHEALVVSCALEGHAHDMLVRWRGMGVMDISPCFGVA